MWKERAEAGNRKKQAGHFRSKVPGTGRAASEKRETTSEAVRAQTQITSKAWFQYEWGHFLYRIENKGNS